MGTRLGDCTCSILNAREEKLLDDEGRVQVRLICNRCGAILDSEILPPTLRRPQPAVQSQQTEAAEGS